MRNIFKLFSLTNESDTPIGLSSIRSEKKPVEENINSNTDDDPDIRWLKITKL